MRKLIPKQNIAAPEKLEMVISEWYNNHLVRTVFKEIANDEFLSCLFNHSAFAPNDVSVFEALKVPLPARNSKYKRLILYTKRVLRTTPNDWYFKTLLALAYHLNGDSINSMYALRRVYEASPNQGVLYYYIGFKAVKEHETSFAIDCFSRAIEQNCKLPYCYLYRAFMYSNTDQYEKGLLDANYLIEQGVNLKEAYYLQSYFTFHIEPTKTNGLQYIGNIKAMGHTAYQLHEIAHVYRDLKDYEKSLEYMNQVVYIEQNDADNLSCRANIKVKMGLFEEALVDIEKALKVDINFAKAYRNRARAYVGLNEINLATKDYQKYLEFCPEDEKVKREMGELGGLY